MKRTKKLIIAILVVILIGIVLLTLNAFMGGPALEEGDKDILILLSGKDEQQGGSVDMAYMVRLENGSLKKLTPIYPGGMTHPSQGAPGGMGGNMRMHDCLWNGPEEGARYAQEIVEYNTGNSSDAVVIVYDVGADAVLDSIRPIYVDGVENNMTITDMVRQNDAYFGYGGSRSGITGTMSRDDAVKVVISAVAQELGKDPKKKEALIKEAMNQYQQGNILMYPEGSFMRLLSTKGIEQFAV